MLTETIKKPALRVVLIRPGSTDFDEQGRIKGTLDIPLNENGTHQAARVADELEHAAIEVVYTAPCQSAMQTAETLSDSLDVKLKRLDAFRNLDHGLWHGKLIEEVRQTQPKVYRLWQDRPETVCPPQGETVESARQRVGKTLQKLLKKHKQGVIALVTPEPLASIVRSLLDRSELGDLWQSECDYGVWECIDLQPSREAVG
jgi:broad specificity phosphatase PhoE